MKVKNLVAFANIIALMLVVSAHFSGRVLLSNTLSLLNPVVHADDGGPSGDGVSGSVSGPGTGPGAPGAPGTDGNTGDTPDYGGGSFDSIGPGSNPDPFCVNQVTPVYTSPNCPGQVHTVNHYFMLCKDGTKLDEWIIDGGWTGSCAPVCNWVPSTRTCSLAPRLCELYRHRDI